MILTMSVHSVEVSSRRAEYLVLPCFLQGARTYLVDSHSLHDLPKGIPPESVLLAEFGYSVDLFGDDPFFIL